MFSQETTQAAVSSGINTFEVIYYFEQSNHKNKFEQEQEGDLASL